MGLKEDLMEKMMGSMLKEEREKMMQEAMEKMMAGMTQEDRRRMMGDLMGRFFGKMSEEEKGNMMQSFMPEMMKTMMGGGMMSMMSQMAGGNREERGMMNMMRKCMSQEFEPPWITMQGIMEEVLKTSGFALVHTPELHSLFRDFLDGKEKEVLSCLASDFLNLEELQAKTSLSFESLIYVVLQLARKGEVEVQLKGR